MLFVYVCVIVCVYFWQGRVAVWRVRMQMIYNLPYPSPCKNSRNASASLPGCSSSTIAQSEICVCERKEMLSDLIVVSDMPTFIHDEFSGFSRPLRVTVSSTCGDSEPVTLITGILSVAWACGEPDGVRAICKSVRWMYELMSMAKLVGLTARSKCDLYSWARSWFRSSGLRPKWCHIR